MQNAGGQRTASNQAGSHVGQHKITYWSLAAHATNDSNRRLSRLPGCQSRGEHRRECLSTNALPDMGERKRGRMRLAASQEPDRAVVSGAERDQRLVKLAVEVVTEL